MSIKPFPQASTAYPRSGFALMIVLAMVVLISVGVVVFILSVQENGQISHNAVAEQEAEVYGRGVTQGIIANLQKEMAAGSGLSTLIGSLPTTPVIMPLTNDGVILPSRSVSGSITTTYNSNVNSAYAQYLNVIKQSLPQPIYTFTSPTTVTGPTCPATTIPTTTASVDGRILDAAYWSLPQLVPAFPGTTPLTPLVPDWIYTSRDGTNPTTFTAAQIQPTTGSSGSLNSSYIMGRYAYNIYDVGGLLNANVVGNGLTTAANFYPPGGTGNSPTPLSQLLIPGYKGSLLSADLTGLLLSGSTNPLTLAANGTAVAAPSTANWQCFMPEWRAQGVWPTSKTAATGFAYVLSGGEFAGWLNEIYGAFNVDPSIDPTNPYGTTIPGSAISNYHFASRQDLINWVTNQWSSQAGGANLTWTLPYLTHFSYDTDAPTFCPDPNRPQDVLSTTSGGNDGLSAWGGDNKINLSFAAPATATPAGVLDSNGNPLVKRRFPLSALALVTPYYPGNEAPTSGAVANQILYDFGLYWVTGQGWVYSDWETGIGNASKKIKLLSSIPKTRSPNFFELLKAAITTGSLGKQYGNVYDGFSTNQNEIGSTIYSSIDCQVIQIGANIISQASAHYFPTDISYTYGGVVNHFYGDKDLPYLYRTRLAQYNLGSVPAMVDGQTPSGGSAQLDAVLLQVELWNPHAPNRITPPPTTLYPSAFRVVPNMVSGGTYLYNSGLNINSTSATPGAWGSTKQYQYTGTLSGDYSSCGGPNCSPEVFGYDNNLSSATPCAIQFSALTPAGTTTAQSTPDLTSFREPCPLVTSALPSGAAGSPSVSSSFVYNLSTDSPTALTAQGAAVNQSHNAYAGITLPAGVNPTPQMYGGGSTPATAYGFLLGFVCAGPIYGGSVTGTVTTAPVADALTSNLVMDQPLSLSLQYQGADGNWHTYDVIDSAMAPKSTNVPEITATPAPDWSAKYVDVGTRFDPRTNRWGLIWDNRHGFSQSPGYPAGNPSGYNGSDYMGGMGGSPGTGGGDNFQVGITGTPSILSAGAPSFHGAWDALSGGGSLSGGGMVGVNTANPNGNHTLPAGPQLNTSGSPSPGWYGSFVPNSNYVAFTATDYHYSLYRGYVQTNQAGAAYAPPTTAASSMLGSQAWIDSANTCYADPDGVIRLGDGGYADNAAGYGLPELMVTPTFPDGTSSTTLSSQLTIGNSIVYSSTFDSRPVVLNRPFQSVGELGYVFRGTPWRTLDFFSPQSGDAALLDVFSAYGPDPWSYAPVAYNTSNTTIAAVPTPTTLVMGRVNLNTGQQPVLAAILKGTWTIGPSNQFATKPVPLTRNALMDGGSYNSTADTIAQALTAWTGTTDLVNEGPLRNRSELVGKYVSGSASMSGGSNGALYSGFMGSSAVTTALAAMNPEVPDIKQQRESIVRALADVGTTRTWNLLIDLAVQTGHLSPNATKLQSFVVSGERHIWVSVAIDRVTGKVIQMQVEPVRL